MKVICKIMQSNSSYDPKNAVQVRDLYYAQNKHIPSIEISGMSFYELNDLLTIQDLSTTKQNKLSKLKPGASAQLFHVGRDRYYYVVQLNTKEELALNDLIKEKEELTKINEQIESQVGHLIKIQKSHEKNIDRLKKIFK